MYCQSCGTRNIETAYVCSTCGAKIIRPRSRRKRLILIGALAVLLVVGVLFYYDHIIHERSNKEFSREYFRGVCKPKGQIAYWDFVELNGTKQHRKGRDIVLMSRDKWDYAEKLKNDAEQACIKDNSEN